MFDFQEEQRLKQAQQKLQKQRKGVAVSGSSIKRIQSNIDKLRPIRDAIEPLVRAVSGFSGIVISGGSVVVFAATDEAVEKISTIAEPYKKKVVVEATKRLKGNPTKGRGRAGAGPR